MNITLRGGWVYCIQVDNHEIEAVFPDKESAQIYLNELIDLSPEYKLGRSIVRLKMYEYPSWVDELKDLKLRGKLIQPPKQSTHSEFIEGLMNRMPRKE